MLQVPRELKTARAFPIGVAICIACFAGCSADEQKTASARPDSSQHSVVDTAAVEPEPEPADLAVPQVYRGYLSIVPDRKSFQACGTRERTWIVDLTGQELTDVYKSLAVNTGDPVFIEVSGVLEPPPEVGFGADYANQIKVLELRRAALEGPGCDENLSGLEFRARGNEPFWRLDITPGGIHFSDFGRSLRLTFPYVRARASEGAWRYEAAIEGADAHRVLIVLEQKPCNDSMSGAYFTLFAEVELDGRAYRGCAIKGEREFAAVE